MKKYLLIALAIVMMFCAASCGSQPAEKTEEGSTELKTLGDVFALETQDFQDLLDKDVYGCAFTYEGRMMRVVADVPEGLYDEIDKLDMSDYEKYEEEKKKLLSEVEVKLSEDITDQILGEEDLEALKGKTGKELLDDGFEYQYYSGDNQFAMNKGLGQYFVTVDGKVDESKAEEDGAKAISDLKVTEVMFSGLSDELIKVK